MPRNQPTDTVVETRIDRRTILVALGGAPIAGAAHMAGYPRRILAAPPALDEAALRREGLRQLTGKHLVVWTDVPPGRAVDELPAVFDAAVDPWCRMLGVAKQKLGGWKQTAFLMAHRGRFRSLGLIPADLPPFKHGYQRGGAFWVDDQPSAYYRRHLVLHEGVHAIMRHFLGGTGRPWYREGMAERLATHTWDGTTLEVDVMPSRREDVPYWGRIQVIREAAAAERWLRLGQVLTFSRVTDTWQYAWCWAACYFLGRHPAYRMRFEKLLEICRNPVRFQSQVAAFFPAGDGTLQADWQAFVDELDYGYDLARAALVHRPAVPLDELKTGTKPISIRAGRGWQSSGIIVQKGNRYRVRAEGRFRIAEGPDGRPWESEPQGVTLHYHRGRPWGMVMAAVVPIGGRLGASNGFRRWIPIGREALVVPPSDGVLYFRVNEHPAQLGDSHGAVHIRVERMPGR